MSTRDLLRHAAAHGLVAQEEIALARDDADEVIEAACKDKVIGLLDQAVAERSIRCDAEVAERIGDRAVSVAEWCLWLERHVLFLHELFRSRDVEHRFIKGSSVAYRFYDHPGLRMFVDIDVLVPAPRFDDVVRMLLDAGHKRDQPEPYRGFSGRFAKSEMVWYRKAEEVDVHRLIADGPFGMRAPSAAMWKRPAAHFEMGGVPIPTFDSHAAFVHACTNAVTSYDRVSLVALRDVAQIGNAIALDVEPALELADELRLGACVTEALRTATRELRWTPPDRLAAIARRPMIRLERMWLDSYRKPTPDWRRAALGLGAVPGATAKAAYALNVARLLAGRRQRRRSKKR